MEQKWILATYLELIKFLLQNEYLGFEDLEWMFEVESYQISY
jgi:hypothetical protein